MNIANENDCIVNLKWYRNYSGWYNVRIEKDMPFEKCMKQIPHIYPV
jgi:hypothetical protein